MNKYSLLKLTSKRLQMGQRRSRFVNEDHISRKQLLLLYLKKGNRGRYLNSGFFGKTVGGKQ